MHILINGIFWAQPTVGSGQYLHGLMRWLPQIAPQHRYTLLLPATGNTLPIPPPPGIGSLVLRSPFDGRSKNIAKLWFEQVGVPAVAHLLRHQHHQTRNAKDEILLHIPYFAPPLRSVVPVITTIPDLIPMLLPEYRGGVHVRGYMNLVSHAARLAAQSITFSEYSRHDIATHLRIPAERITATLLAADERYVPAPDSSAVAEQVAQRYGLRLPFLYYVGGLDARKNVAVLLQAMAHMQRHHRYTLPVMLAIAGRSLGSDRRLFPDIDAMIAELHLHECVRRIDVPHEDGPLLYQACTVFAFPSRYEGFGLPPLEAMRCGAPVVASTSSSLPEVVGDAALCVAPDDVDGWAGALSRLLCDTSLRTMMQQRGIAQAAHFSWQRVAEETVAVYERVIPCD